MSFSGTICQQITWNQRGNKPWRAPFIQFFQKMFCLCRLVFSIFESFPVHVIFRHDIDSGAACGKKVLIVFRASQHPLLASSPLWYSAQNAGTLLFSESAKTLLDAMAAVRKYRETVGAVLLSENKQLLKERLGAVMNDQTDWNAYCWSASALSSQTFNVFSLMRFANSFSISEKKAHFIFWRSTRRALWISKSHAMKMAVFRVLAIWLKRRWKIFLAIANTENEAVERSA